MAATHFDWLGVTLYGCPCATSAAASCIQALNSSKHPFGQSDWPKAFDQSIDQSFDQSLGQYSDQSFDQSFDQSALLNYKGLCVPLLRQVTCQHMFAGWYAGHHDLSKLLSLPGLLCHALIQPWQATVVATLGFRDVRLVNQLVLISTIMMVRKPSYHYGSSSQAS